MRNSWKREPHCDGNGYSIPKPPIPVTSLTTQISKPALPLRNQPFFSTGGLNVSVDNNEANISQSCANYFNNISYKN